MTTSPSTQAVLAIAHLAAHNAGATLSPDLLSQAQAAAVEVLGRGAS